MSQIGKRIASILATILLLVLVAVFLFPDVSLAGTDDVKRIRVVLDQDYPPYSFHDGEGNLQGITIDQWKLFSERTGITVDITGMEWNEAYQAMYQGKFDVIDTISYSNDREKFYDFTEPYATIDVLIFFQKDIPGITDVNSLRGFLVGAKKGDNSVNVLKNHGITDIKEYDSSEKLIEAAKNGEIDVFVMGKPPAQYYLHKMGFAKEFRYSDTLLYTSKFYRAVNQGDIILISALKSGFDKISEDEYRRISDKWFGKTNPELYNSALAKTITLVVISVGSIVMLLLAWNTTLKKKVRQQTSELSKSLEELSASESRIRALLEATPDMFFLYNRDGLIMDFHYISEGLLGSNPDKLLNHYISDVLPKEQSELVLSAIRSALDSGDIQTIELSLDFHNTLRHFEARLAACSDDLAVGIVRDITDRKQTEEKMVDISIHDSLTGLYNRYCFENEIINLERKHFSSVYIAIFDLDGLKIINDTLGHHAGDQYLVNAAKLIVESFPKDGIISRIGGDEICVILLDKKQEDIDRYMQVFDHNIDRANSGNKKVPISISVGSVFSSQGPFNINEMIREADNQMYRVKLHRRQSVKSEVVQMMKNMLEVRDFITEGHVSRMEELAVSLARAVNLPDKDMADIRLLAQFHDIGKVGIPDNILFKPSKLNDEEYDIMKRHTEIGHRIAVSSNDLLPIADFILKHHEYWDGRGYPFGLEGDEIPMECRILSIVDAYDAMTNDRPYRKAMTVEAALQELEKCAGAQFDPNLVKVFVRMITNQ